MSAEGLGGRSKHRSFLSDLSVILLLQLSALVWLFRDAISNGMTVTSISSFIRKSGFYSELFQSSRGWDANGLMALDVERAWNPTRTLVHQWLEQGRLPLWNPYASTGLPFLAEEQTQASDLLYLATLRLFPWHDAVVVYVLISFLLAGVFAFFYARALRLSLPAAVTSAFAYSFSGPLVVWFMRPNAQTYVFFPLLLLIVELGFHKRNLWRLSLAAVPISFIVLSGHSQVAFYAVTAFMVYVVVKSWQHRSSTPFLRSTLSWILVPGTLAFLLVSFKLLPFVELLVQAPISNHGRGGMLPLTWTKIWERCILSGLAEPSRFLGRFARLLFPYFFGSTSEGTPLNARYEMRIVPLDNFAETAAYVGTTVSLLATWAFTQRKHIVGSSRLLPLSIVSALAACVFLGVPLVNLVRALPVFSHTSMDRVVFVFCLGLALWGGVGIQRWGELSPAQRRRTGGTLAVVVLLLFASFQAVFSEARPPRSELYFMLPLLTSLTAFGVLARFPIARSNDVVSSWSLAAVAVFESVMFAYGFIPFQPPEIWHPETERVALVKEQLPDNQRLKYEGVFQPSFNYAHSLLMDANFSVLTAASTHDVVTQVSRARERRPPGHRSTFANLDTPWLDIISVGLVGVDLNQLEAFPEVLDNRSLKPLIVDSDLALWENEAAVDRARIYCEAEIAKDTPSAIRVLEKRRHHHDALLLSGDVDERHPRCDANSELTRVTNTRFGLDEIQVDVSTDGYGHLFISDTYYPGWDATVNGRGSEILRAFRGYRAVEIPPGDSKVIFRYAPLTARLGSILTIMGLIAFGGALSVSAGLRRITARRK